MGNDPGNGTDPTGGLFGVGGSGCAAAAGMSGYGGMAGRIAGTGNFLKVVSTVSAVASAAAEGMGLGGSIATNLGNNNQSLNQSANNGNFEASGFNVGSGDANGGLFSNEGSDDDENLLTPKIWYYVLKTEGGPHSLVYDPENDMIYETNHPTVNDKAVDGRENWKAGGLKSQGYAYKMGKKKDRDAFWGFMGGRGTLLLSPVVVLKPDRATAFFERNNGKKWNYNIAVNNCKHYVIRGLTAGAALIPPSAYFDPAPFTWLGPYTMSWNSSMAKPQSIFKSIFK